MCKYDKIRVLILNLTPNGDVRKNSYGGINFMFGSRTHTRSQFEHITDKVYEWRSSDKNFFYYDKEKDERIPLPKDAELIPLTHTSSVTGLHMIDLGKPTSHSNRIFSNEFVDYKNEIVRVREMDRITKTTTVLFEGPYSPTVRDAISSVPYCNYTKNVYCLLDGEVVKLELKKSSLSPWIEFEDSLRESKEYLTDGHCVRLGAPEKRTTGTVNYYVPTFKLGDITAEENAKADEVAAEVESKLEKNRNAGSKNNENSAQVPVNIEVKEAETSETTPDGQISLDDVPF